MLGVGDKIPEFQVVGAKAGFTQHEQNGESAFEAVTQDSSFGPKISRLYAPPKLSNTAISIPNLTTVMPFFSVVPPTTNFATWHGGVNTKTSPTRPSCGCQTPTEAS